MASALFGGTTGRRFGPVALLGSSLLLAFGPTVGGAAGGPPPGISDGSAGPDRAAGVAPGKSAVEPWTIRYGLNPSVTPEVALEPLNHAALDDATTLLVPPVTATAGRLKLRALSGLRTVHSVAPMALAVCEPPIAVPIPLGPASQFADILRI